MDIEPDFLQTGSNPDLDRADLKLIDNVGNKDSQPIELKLPEKSEELETEMKNIKQDDLNETDSKEESKLDDLVPPGKSVSNEEITVNDSANTEGDSATDTLDDSARASPDPNCAICLGKLENKSFTDSCFHQFCFTCLLEWSKIKAECPLCKQSFKSIIHNVRSIEDYDQYYITVRNTKRNPWRNSDFSNRPFRYPSTLTSERWRHLAFERSLDLDFQDYRLTFAPHLYRGLSSRFPPVNRSGTTSDYRRNIYNSNLWAKNEDVTVRYRETNPEFFHQNPACTHRLTPWLNRELVALLQNSENQVNFVLELILALIMRFNIQSSEFYEHLFPYLQGQTAHFVHEFYHFARSPYDMTSYDRTVQYEENEPSNSRSNTSSPSSIIEVPVENESTAAPPLARKPYKRHRYPTRASTFENSTTTTSSIRVKHYRSARYCLERSNALSIFSLDMPGTSQQFSTFNSTEVVSLPDRTEASKSESDDDECVVVDYVKGVRKPPDVIDIGSSSDEGEVKSESERNDDSSAPGSTVPLNQDSIDRVPRKNRCTFHYDYSSDSCTDQASSATSTPNNHLSTTKKLKIKSFIGNLKSVSLPSTSDQSSNHSHSHSKKHKKHKKHKHKHHRHRHHSSKHSDN